jgi:hypothetical protein
MSASRELHNRILSPNDVYNEIIICHKCKTVAFEPTNCLSCDKIFCMECLGQQEDSRCPMCMAKIDQAMLKPNKMSQLLIDSLDARCINPECTFRGSYHETISHLLNCDKNVVECPTCGKMITASQMGTHTSTCTRRKVSCTQHELGCLWMGEQKDLSSHLSVCIFEILSPAFNILREENRQLREKVAQLSDELQKRVEPEIAKVRNDLMIIYINDHGHVWKIPKEDFFAKKFDEAIVSEKFSLMGYEWVLEVYPSGASYLGYDGTPCLFLRFAEESNPIHVKCVLFVDHPEDLKKTKEMDYLHEHGKGYGGKVDIKLRTSDMEQENYVFDDNCVHLGVMIKAISIEMM